MPIAWGNLRPVGVRAVGILQFALLGLFLPLAAPGRALGASYSAPADQDSWLDSGLLGGNHGSESELRVNAPQLLILPERRAILRFDLSAIPPGATLQSATLELRVSQTGSNTPVEIYRVTNSWAEGSVTWGSSANDYDSGTLYGTFAPSTSSVNIDLTALVAEWLDGTHPNHGILLITSSPTEARVASREWAVAGERPQLHVVTVDYADLEVTKDVDEPAPREGQTITYTVTVRNNGPTDATGVELTDVLPSGVTYVSDIPSQGAYDSGTGVWSVGSVTNGSIATLSLSASVDSVGASSARSGAAPGLPAR